MAYVSALLGDLWALVNPLDTLFAWAEALWARLRPGGRLAIGLRYPEALGAWPAVVLFLAFVWMELVWERSDTPAYLAIESGGETGKEFFQDIRDPPAVQHEIYAQMEENENRKYDRIGREAAEGALWSP